MENLKRLKPTRGRAALMAASICLIAPASAAPPINGSDAATLELSKRYESIEEAQELLRKGDEAYLAAKFSTAVDAYAGARELTPDAPATGEFRAFATERFIQASVEYAKSLSRKGDVAGAKAAVDKVLSPSVAPNDPTALNLRAQLDDPIRTNPALTGEFAEKVDQVRRLLYIADGAYHLGNFDQSMANYQEVLRIDPTNTAARRGMEKIAAVKADYQRAAYDQTRGELLAQTAQAWELPVTPKEIDPALLDGGSQSLDAPSYIPVANKLERIIIPVINFEQTTLQEAVEFLRARATEYDTLELDPARKGINFNINLGDASSPQALDILSRTIDLQLRNIPLSKALGYITQITHTTYRTDDFGVTIVPAGSTSTELITRSFKVGPDFLSTISSSVRSTSEEPTDPFDDAPAAGLIPTRMTVQEVFRASGITFPEGATASLLPGTGQLLVTNTAANLEVVQQIVEAASHAEPVQVILNVTIVRTEQINLEELGFDWTLSNFGFGSTGIDGNEFNLGGGTQGNGGDFSDMLNNPGAPSGNPITAGNRSGSTAITGDSTEAIIASGNDRSSVGFGTDRAPGIFSINGTLDNAAFNLLMRGLDQKKGVDMVTKPSVITRSDQAAKVEVIREFPYPTAYEPPELPNSIGSTDGFVDDGVFGGNSSPSFTPVTPSHPTDFVYRNVGVTMEVLPTVGADRQNIGLTISPQLVEFEGFINYGSPINSSNPNPGLNPLAPATIRMTDNNILQPIFSSLATTTNVTVQNGSTLVLGGLMQQSLQNVEDQTPILGDIPLIGRLFHSDARQSVSTAVLIFVNVELVDPGGRRF